MTWLILTLVTFACFALVFYIKNRQYNQAGLRLPYQLKHPLFEPAEREFLSTLQRAVGDDYLILAKVRLADVVEVTAIERRAPWYHATNRISAARFDFLLCDVQHLEPVCAIELEEASQANAILDELCEAIGLPLVRIPPLNAGAYGEVREAIDGALKH